VIASSPSSNALPGFAAGLAGPQARVEARPARCGHNLLAPRRARGDRREDTLAQRKLAGTIRLYGTPAERAGGKIYMARRLFEGVDVVLTWHRRPQPGRVSTTLANINAKFRFRASRHAASSLRKAARRSTRCC